MEECWGKSEGGPNRTLTGGRGASRAKFEKPPLNIRLFMRVGKRMEWFWRQKPQRPMSYHSEGKPEGKQSGINAIDPSSATRPTGRVDCNHDALAGFAAARG